MQVGGCGARPRRCTIAPDDVGSGPRRCKYNGTPSDGQIRFYYLGHKYIPATKTAPFRFEHAKPGDTMVLDFLRFEAE